MVLWTKLSYKGTEPTSNYRIISNIYTHARQLKLITRENAFFWVWWENSKLTHVVYSELTQNSKFVIMCANFDRKTKKAIILNQHIYFSSEKYVYIAYTEFDKFVTIQISDSNVKQYVVLHRMRVWVIWRRSIFRSICQGTWLYTLKKLALDNSLREFTSRWSLFVPIRPI